MLAEWIVEAALADGYLVHGTSIPGVAQRTGSTTYYVELFAERDHGSAPTAGLLALSRCRARSTSSSPPSSSRWARSSSWASRRPPAPRSSPARIGSTRSTRRSRPGAASTRSEELSTAARAFSRALIAFDALAARPRARHRGQRRAAGRAGGAAARCPSARPPTGRRSSGKGVQVDANLSGFEVGLAAARAAADGGRPRPGRDGRRPRSPRRGRRPAAESSPASVTALPGEPATPCVQCGRAPGSIDYQDARYAGATSSGCALRAAAATRELGSARGAPPGGVDDLRGRHPGGPAQDAAEPVRAHPPGRARSGTARSSSPTTSSRTSTRSTASCPHRLVAPVRALGRAPLAARAAHAGPARADDDRQRAICASGCSLGAAACARSPTARTRSTRGWSAGSAPSPGARLGRGTGVRGGARRRSS